jgi:hypothetical protein
MSAAPAGRPAGPARRASGRIRRPARWLVLGFLVALLVSLATYVALMRTDPGRARVLALVLDVLDERLNGELTVGRIEGRLRLGARIYDISLIGHDGVPLLVADSAEIDYRLGTFLGGDILINRVVIYDAEVSVHLMPGDTLWNFQQILADTTPARPDEAPGATVIEQLRLVSTRVTVRLPWEPEEGLVEEAREKAIEAAVTGTDRLMVERVPGGFLRTMLFDFTDARLTDVFVAGEERGGSSLHVDAAAGEIRLWSDPPMELRDLRGDLALHEGIVRYSAERIVLPQSTLTSMGIVDATRDDTAYDLVVEGSDIAFTDVQWLYPNFPEDGEGDLWLRLQSRPEGLLILARRLRLETPDTRLTGTFGVILGDTVRFMEVDLQADPLDARTVDRLLPQGLPVTGLRVGAAEFRGSAS